MRAVIKPIYGAASIGVVRVDSYEQLEKTYIRVQQEIAGARIVDGALVQGDGNPDAVRLLSQRRAMMVHRQPVKKRASSFPLGACRARPAGGYRPRSCWRSTW